jgi:hypothetical protein
MKKILSFAVMVAALAMVGCCGQPKKAEQAACPCCPQTEVTCPEGVKSCAECPKKECCPKAEVAQPEAPAAQPAQ